MSLKECVECAFGTDAENRILHFLVEKELHNCGNDADRWLVLFGRCEQWRNEVTVLLNKSWELYQKFPKNSISYQKDMELNYPKFDEALEYLAQNIGECEVVRMN